MIRLRYLLLSVLPILVAFSAIPFVLSYEYGDADFTVPSWIKNNAGWWADEQIDDGSFVSGIQWMITNDVIILPPTELGSGDDENVIPRWVKTTAGWWADDEISDSTFVAAIKYLIGEGIIIVEQETVEEVVEEEVEEIKEFHMVVNGENCCENWGYIGMDWRFQIKTFDEYRGNSLDGVTINAKIISKDGELRHYFGALTTEDGIYKSYITIPGIEWYGDNILSVTGKYKGIEKTIEREFAVFKISGQGSSMGSTVLKSAKFYPTNATSDGENSFTELNGAHSVDTFTISGDSHTYAIVTAQADDGVQIVDISGLNVPFSGVPFSGIQARDAETDGSNSFTELEGPRNVATYTIDSATASDLSLSSTNYAIVAGAKDNGLQVIDIGIPTAIVAKDSETDNANGFDELAGAFGIATFKISTNSTYRGAIVTASAAGSVMSVDITNPTAIVEKDVETDGNNSFDELSQPRGVAIWNATSSTYAIVVSESDDGVQIIDISDPTNIKALDAETDGVNNFDELDGASGVSTFTCGKRTYAIIASNVDDGIQLIDVTNPTNIIPVSSQSDETIVNGVVYNEGFSELDGARNVAMVTVNTVQYAIVTAQTDDGVQIIEPLCAG